MVLATLACIALLTGCGQAGNADGPGSSAAAPRTSSSATPQPATPQPAAMNSATTFVKHADFLQGISCTSASSCVAVGWYYYGPADHYHPLLEHWNGSAWQVQAPPPDGQVGTLSGVSCASADHCTAVGSLILGWNGHRWRLERRATSFDAVSCPAADRCVAVGVTRAGAPVAGTWNGSSWRVSAMPRPPHRSELTTLASVSCATRTACLAVGDYYSGTSARPSTRVRDRILAESWNGSTWRPLPALDVARRDKLASVSCTGPRLCVAVGSARARVTLAERWNGTNWRSERTGNLHPVGYSELTGVSCVTPGRCMAVGDYNLAIPFSERPVSADWTIVAMARPVGRPGTSGLTVSCSGSVCVAAGTYDGQALTERWNGAVWRLLLTPNPR